MKYGFLTQEQLRFIRRSSKCSLFKPEQIFHMIDLVYRIKNEERHFNPHYLLWKYEHDIVYILEYFPTLEVHSYMAAHDPKFMKSYYTDMENLLENQDRYEKLDQDEYQSKLARYLAIKDIIPIVKSQILLCE